MIHRVKRCPFCNSHNLVMEITSATYAVQCNDCKAIGPFGTQQSIAVVRWNGTHRHCNPSALVCNRKSNRNDMKEVDL